MEPTFLTVETYSLASILAIKKGRATHMVGTRMTGTDREAMSEQNDR